ncbi:MAG: hypothetical protein HS129_15240 [Leptospiraceae bacterium]|nr:hypothetical protein [Leptospiraceae bacterium]NUM40831.1 hypothetical protein [Leptospiraceae bacterium]
MPAKKKKAVKKTVRKTLRRKPNKVPPAKIHKTTSGGIAVDIPNDMEAK